ncbi:hypothetical protein D046_5105B, partial [Vibrio parahaemolyticus V-223/04]
VSRPNKFGITVVVVSSKWIFTIRLLCRVWSRHQ